MELSGHTKPFAVLGHPIGHSLSPPMHNAAIRSLDMDAVYLAFDVEPSRLLTVLPAMADMGFGGVNLTVPLKEVAFNGLDDLADSARLLGAVNTVEILPSGLRGHNTDGEGFLMAVRDAFGVEIGGLSVFVVGSGGAGRALALTCAARGAARVAVTDLDPERADRVAAEAAGHFPGVSVEAVPAGKEVSEDACRKADLVIQATPVGMNPEDPSLLPPEAFGESQMVFDLVYMYPETAFMKAAAGAGARTSNGLRMLAYQGARAFSIWTGKEPPAAVMLEALETAVYGTRQEG
jgi:shikimate dehydrogenase